MNNSINDLIKNINNNKIVIERSIYEEQNKDYKKIVNNIYSQYIKTGELNLKLLSKLLDTHLIKLSQTTFYELDKKGILKIIDEFYPSLIEKIPDPDSRYNVALSGGIYSQTIKELLEIITSIVTDADKNNLNLNVNKFNKSEPKKHEKVEKNSEDSDEGIVVAKESLPEEHPETELNRQNFINSVKNFLYSKKKSAESITIEKYFKDKLIDNDTLCNQINSLNEKKKKKKKKNKENTSTNNSMNQNNSGDNLKEDSNEEIVANKESLPEEHPETELNKQNFINNVKNFLDSKKKKKKKKNKENTSTNNSMNQNNSGDNLKNEIELLRSQLKDLQNKFNASQLENNNLKNANNNLKDKNKDLQNKFNASQVENKNLKNENNNLKNANNNLKDKNKNLQNKFNASQLENKNLKNENEDLQNKFNASQVENKNLKNKNKNLKNENNNLKNENNNLKSNFKDLELKNINSNKQIKELQTEIKELQEKIKFLFTENEKLQTENKKLQTENKESENENLQTENIKLQEKIKFLFTENVNLVNNVNRLIFLKDNLNYTISYLQTENERLIKEIYKKNKIYAYYVDDDNKKSFENSENHISNNSKNYILKNKFFEMIKNNDFKKNKKDEK